MSSGSLGFGALAPRSPANLSPCPLTLPPAPAGGLSFGWGACSSKGWDAQGKKGDGASAGLWGSPGLCVIRVPGLWLCSLRASGRRRRSERQGSEGQRGRATQRGLYWPTFPRRPQGEGGHTGGVVVAGFPGRPRVGSTSGSRASGLPEPGGLANGGGFAVPEGVLVESLHGPLALLRIGRRRSLRRKQQRHRSWGPKACGVPTAKLAQKLPVTADGLLERIGEALLRTHWHTCRVFVALVGAAVVTATTVCPFAPLSGFCFLDTCCPSEGTGGVLGYWQPRKPQSGGCVRAPVASERRLPCRRLVGLRGLKDGGAMRLRWTLSPRLAPRDP